MSLWLAPRVGLADPVGHMEIRRREYLDLSDKAAIADAVSTYEVRIDSEFRATVSHRYGDGAWVLLRKALDAAVPVPEEQDRDAVPQ